MYGNSSARDILLLAAEDAFEFERWRDAGPVTADIDPEVKAAEIAEFEALGIPMSSELDGLRRELEHAPKVREAIRHSSLTLRRNGRASASSLVALGPQQLMPTGPGGMPWGWPMGMDPRLAAAMDPRMAARMAGHAIGAESPDPRARKSSRRAESRVAAAADLDDDDERDEAEPPRARSRKVAGVAMESEPVEAEVVDDDFDEDDDDRDDDDDEDDDEDERPHGKARRREPERREPPKRRAEPKRARASARSRDEWDDEDGNDDRFESAVAPRPSSADQKTTWILGGISAAAVIALLVIAFGDKDDDGAAVAQQQQQQQPLQQQAAPVQPPPPVEAVGAIDPATGLPLGQAPVAPEPAPAAPSTGGRRSSGVSSGVRSSSTTPVPASGTSSGVNPFGGFKTPDDPGALASGTPPPASGGTTQPAAGGTTPPPSNGTTPPPASGGTGDAAAGAAAAGAAGGAATPPPTEQPKPVEEPKPAEPPKPEEPQLTKSKMTPAIREAVVAKVGDLQACYQDAVVGKPDLAGQVVFTISLDQDGVVKKVEIAKDEVKYGVAKCSAKKIQRWTLPSAGIPIIFDLPFDFKS